MLAEWRIVYHGSTGVPAVTAAVTLRGDLDIAVRSLLTEHLAPLAARRLDRLEFDLAAVTYMDCAAASALIDVGRAAMPPGRQLVIRGASRSVSRLLVLSGLDEGCLLLPGRSRRRAGQLREAGVRAGYLLDQGSYE